VEKFRSWNDCKRSTFAHKELKIEKFNDSFVQLNLESFVLQPAIWKHKDLKINNLYNYCVSEHICNVKHAEFWRMDCISASGRATLLGPINRASPYLWASAPSQDRIYKPSTAQPICNSKTNVKVVALTWKWRQNPVFKTVYILNRNRWMDNVQKHNTYTLCGLSLRANYTDLTTAACRRS
jgi:hypothetical protein